MGSFSVSFIVEYDPVNSFLTSLVIEYLSIFANFSSTVTTDLLLHSSCVKWGGCAPWTAHLQSLEHFVSQASQNLAVFFKPRKCQWLPRPHHISNMAPPSILIGWCPSCRPCTLRCLVSKWVDDSEALGQCGMIPGLPLSSCSTCCMPGVGAQDPIPVLHRGHQCTGGRVSKHTFNHP